MRDANRAVRDVAPQWQPSSTLEALDELVRVAESVPALVARRAGLSTSELHALRHLMQGPLGSVELAGRLGLTSAAGSGVVDRLVARGHAARKPHHADGRRKQVEITPHGQQEVLESLAPMFQALAQLDSSLDPAARQVVLDYLRGATAAMRTVIRTDA